MLIGIIFATLVAYGLLRLIYRNMQDLENKDPIEISGNQLNETDIQLNLEDTCRSSCIIQGAHSHQTSQKSQPRHQVKSVALTQSQKI